MNEFSVYTYSEIFFLFVGSALAVFGILYKVSFIDEAAIEKDLKEEEKNDAAKSASGNLVGNMEEKLVKKLDYNEVIDFLKQNS